MWLEIERAVKKQNFHDEKTKKKIESFSLQNSEAYSLRLRKKKLRNQYKKKYQCISYKAMDELINFIFIEVYPKDLIIWQKKKTS